MQQSGGFRTGELVRVRSKAEILATLDQNGRLEGLPFMPEMFEYCGRQFRVYKRAHKTCDFASGTGSRRVVKTVHLEDARCDGSAHGGCMAGCLIFWKEAWLTRIIDDTTSPTARAVRGAEARLTATSTCTEEQVRASAKRAGEPIDDPNPTYVCQATQLLEFTTPLSPWDFRQYVEAYRSGNITSLWSMVPRFAYRAYDNLVNLGIGWGPVLRSLYDVFQKCVGGLPYPARTGTIPAGMKTPTCTLGLQQGELVRVKDYRAILDTIDSEGKNRGMAFGAEMMPYCGGTYRVRDRVDRIIDERTGKMLKMKNSCIILDGVICQAKYNKRLLFCPRSTLAYWREVWLERVDGAGVRRPGVNDAADDYGTFTR
jgi:hypothetical protein